MAQSDTIVAVATPPGPGAIGIIRMSGKDALDHARSICQPSLPASVPPRYAIYTGFVDPKGELLDKGLLLFFPAPHSFTGEDVIELQVHGSHFVLQAIVERLIKEGARQAEAGEFSRRAFMHNKMDLVQAEAIADLINSDTEVAARAAMQSLQGGLSARINEIGDRLVKLRVYVEAALDFPQEEIDFLADEQLAKECQQLIALLTELVEDAHQGSLVNELREVVILGEPNVGKSSLFNALCRDERAIVSNLAGTTRDLVREVIQLQSVPIVFTDTAGLRSTKGQIEEEGIRRAWRSAEQGNLILLVYDARHPPSEEIVASLVDKKLADQTLLIANKIDLCGGGRGSGRGSEPKALKQKIAGKTFPLVRLSVKENVGMDLLVEQLMAIYGRSHQPPKFSARFHQLEKLRQAKNCLEQGYKMLQEQASGELLAEDLNRARSLLDEILGSLTTDELLDKIFADFCIGK